MAFNVFCLLDGCEMGGDACPRVFSHLTDPSEVELCRSCEHHPEEGFADPGGIAPKEAPKTDKAKTIAGAGSLKEALLRLSEASGVNIATVSYHYHQWKKTGAAPQGAKGKQVCACLADLGLSWADVAACIVTEPKPVGGVKTEKPCPEPKRDPQKDPHAKTFEEVEREVFGDPDPDEPATSLDPVQEAERYGITIPKKHNIYAELNPGPYGGGHSLHLQDMEPCPLPITTRRIEVSEFYLREPSFEEVLTEMKRRLPVGTKITIEL